MTLRVEVSIIPFGEMDKARKLWTFDLCNLGQVGFGHCEYGMIEFDHEKGEAGMYDETVIHRRHYGALALVLKALEQRDRIIEAADRLEAA